MIPRQLSRSLYSLKTQLSGEASVLRHLEELNRTQCLTKEKIEELRWKKAKRLLRHSYKTVPFYKKKLRRAGINPKDIRNRGDFQKIPPLTKKEVKENLQEMLSVSFSRNQLVENHTGGSTGVPLTFYQTREFLNRANAHQIRNYQWCGYRLGDKIAFLWGLSYQFEFMTIWDRLDDLILNKRWYNTFNIEKMPDYAKDLSEFRPRLIEAYASSAYRLAQIAEEKHINGIEPEAIQATAEMLYPKQRKKIEGALGCEVFEKYGAREVNVIAHECPNHCGMHINSENNFVEFIKDGEPVSENETGRIIITNLNNFGMPFIRYEIGDLASPIEGECDCGIRLPKMGNLKGRESDIIKGPKNEMIHPIYFTRLFFDEDNVKQFKIVQKNKKRLLFKVVWARPAESVEEFEERIRQRVHREISPYFEIAFDYPEKILPEPSGKFRFTVSNTNE